MSVPFRFDRPAHEYTALDTGEILPSITQMLERTGWTDSTFYSDEDAARGTEVHRLCAAYDLGALDVTTCVTRYRNYLLAHVKAMDILRPEIFAVEQAHVHPRWRFAGTPDREVRLNGVSGVLEIKSGAPDKSHAKQTALQALLVADGIPSFALGRWCLYLKPSGRFSLVAFTDRHDFDVAFQIIRECVR